MQAKKIKIIKVSPEGRKKLAERYGCRRETMNEFGGVKADKVVFY